MPDQTPSADAQSAETATNADDHVDLAYERIDAFREMYANNVRFEASTWDIRTIFGVLDQSEGETVVRQHTAMNVSWAQAKLIIYFLYLNVLIHEESNGPITVPASVQPPPIEQYFKELHNDPRAQALIARVNNLRAELF